MARLRTWLGLTAALLGVVAIVALFVWLNAPVKPAVTSPPVAEETPEPDPSPPAEEIAEAPAPEPEPPSEPEEWPADAPVTLIGTVTDHEDAPVPGVTVRVVVEGQPDLTTTTSPEGRYTLRKVPQKPEVLEFSARGYHTETFKRPGLPQAPRARWDAQLTPAPGIFGQVVLEGGQPVTEAFVNVRRSRRPEAWGYTDRSGRFALDVETDADTTWVIEARHGQYGQVVEQVQGAREITLVLQGGGFVSGYVRRPDGTPVQGFSVSASPFTRRGGGPGAQSFDTPDGSFRLGPVAPGTHTLWAAAEGHQPGDLRGVQIDAGKDTSNIIITLKPSTVLTGRVTDARTGRPVEGAWIRPAEWNSQVLAETVGASTGADGRYRLSSLPGPRTSITVNADGYREVLLGGVEGPPGQTIVRDFELTPVTRDAPKASELTGVGAVLSRTRQGIRVHELVNGGPASEALEPGDIIVRVGDINASNGDLKTVVQAIRGEAGTDVELWVRRKGSEEPQRVVITRDRVVMERRN